MQAKNVQRLESGTEEIGGSERRDQAFETLSNPRRRQTLRYLRAYDGDGPVLIRELAEQITAVENGIPAAEVTYKQRKRVYTSLYQSHLPRLHKYGFVEYDADRGTVELTPEAEQLDVFLEIVPKGHLPWSNVYLGTSALAVAAAVAVYIGVVPFVTGWHAFVFFTLLFGCLSIAHTVKTRQNTFFDE